MFAFLIVVMASQVHVYIKTSHCTFQICIVIIGQLYLNKATQTKTSSRESNGSSWCGKNQAAATMETGCRERSRMLGRKQGAGAEAGCRGGWTGAELGPRHWPERCVARVSWFFPRRQDLSISGKDEL